MNQTIHAEHKTDEQGNPTGGTTLGTGIEIHWQDGPLGRGEDRKEPNGAFIEGVLAAAIDRLQFFQNSKFACRENAVALTHMETALLWAQQADARPRGARRGRDPRQMKEPAHVAYDAYGDYVEWKNFRGDPMPKWADLPEKIQGAWRAACDAIAPSLPENAE